MSCYQRRGRAGFGVAPVGPAWQSFVVGHEMITRRRRILPLIVAVSVAAALQIATGVFYSFEPGNWRAVVPGMARGFALRILGPPTLKTSDLKGQDTWRTRSLVNERCLIVRYGPDGAVAEARRTQYWRFGTE